MLDDTVTFEECNVHEFKKIEPHAAIALVTRTSDKEVVWRYRDRNRTIDYDFNMFGDIGEFEMFIKSHWSGIKQDLDLVKPTAAEVQQAIEDATTPLRNEIESLRRRVQQLERKHDTIAGGDVW